MPDLLPTKFHFDGGTKTYEGFYDPSRRWNGWPMVWVTPVALEALLVDCGLPDDGRAPETFVGTDAEGSMEHDAAELRADAKKAGPDGLVLLDGWTPDLGAHDAVE